MGTRLFSLFIISTESPPPPPPPPNYVHVHCALPEVILFLILCFLLSFLRPGKMNRGSGSKSGVAKKAILHYINTTISRGETSLFSLLHAGGGEIRRLFFACQHEKLMLYGHRASSLPCVHSSICVLPSDVFLANPWHSGLVSLLAFV